MGKVGFICQLLKLTFSKKLVYGNIALNSEHHQKNKYLTLNTPHLMLVPGFFIHYQNYILKYAISIPRWGTASHILSFLFLQNAKLNILEKL